jgi:hypothetical protein
VAPEIRRCVGCGLPFTVPGDRSPRGNPTYCTYRCERARPIGRLAAVLALRQLARMHPRDYEVIRLAIRAKLRGPRV